MLKTFTMKFKGLSNLYLLHLCTIRHTREGTTVKVSELLTIKTTFSLFEETLHQNLGLSVFEPPPPHTHTTQNHIPLLFQKLLFQTLFIIILEFLFKNLVLLLF